ncbi:helix-turn-helix transcriptional regulator [Clostridium culturomicium]|uniref:helix-turn-helix transcriptional regulator n=1 Tax=Clostridium culturomicium TaxID=1499683 RepID=UPI0006932233|nr:helix-turn-helix transcriptional regulator [Clostridium culturomicium]
MSNKLKDLNTFTTLLGNLLGVPVNYINYLTKESNFNPPQAGAEKFIYTHSKDFMKKLLSNNWSENKIYKISSLLHMEYTLCKVPNMDIAIVIGPYTTKPFNISFLDIFETQYEISESTRLSLQNYFAGVTVIDFSKIDAACNLLFFNFFGEVDVDYDKEVIIAENDIHGLFIHDSFAPLKETNVGENIESMYTNENLYLQIITDGDIDGLSKLIGSLKSNMKFKLRSNNTLRDMKNYGFTLNSLSRKAAERGFVHPFYINEASTELAIRIENAASENELFTIFKEIPSVYCKIVREKSLKEYSLLIRKAINYINLNLNSNLTLSSIANNIVVNPNYLSSKFNKEVHESIASFINRRRIEESLKLMKNTSLSITAISEQVGFNDVNYFSKVFKKLLGISPSEYRKNKE